MQQIAPPPKKKKKKTGEEDKGEIMVGRATAYTKEKCAMHAEG